jgi:hypothetical protein
MRFPMKSNARSLLLILFALGQGAAAQTKTAPASATVPPPVVAPQRPAELLPQTRADILLEAGRWTEAEDAYYAQSRVSPREPLARAALGRFLAMKGAVVPGTILIEEAMKFGLDAPIGRALLAPCGEVQSWRVATMRDPSAPAVSLKVRPPRDTMALFQMPLPPSKGEKRSGAASAKDTIWADVYPRIMTPSDMKKTDSPQMGIEMLEQQLPAIDVPTYQLTLNADTKTALHTIGKRYQVLRDASDIRVLVGPERVMSLAPALRELRPRWWQLDLLHGILVVR